MKHDTEGIIIGFCIIIIVTMLLFAISVAIAKSVDKYTHCKSIGNTSLYCYGDLM